VSLFIAIIIGYNSFETHVTVISSCFLLASKVRPY
jgi:hypothetical protein